MCLYTYPRLVKEGKELGVFLCIQVNGIPMYGRVILRFSPCFPKLFTVLFFHNKSISNVKQNCDFGAVFSFLQGQVLLRYRNLFRVPQKITCSEQGFRKIRFANGLELAKNSTKLFFIFVRKYADFDVLNSLCCSFTK